MYGSDRRGVYSVEGFELSRRLDTTYLKTFFCYVGAIEPRRPPSNGTAPSKDEMTRIESLHSEVCPVCVIPTYPSLLKQELIIQNNSHLLFSSALVV